MHKRLCSNFFWAFTSDYRERETPVSGHCWVQQLPWGLVRQMIEAIDKEGSIAAAAWHMSMSYRRA